MVLTFKTLPLSTNALYAHTGRRRFLTSDAKANKEAMGWEARSQYKGAPLTGLLKVSVSFFWSDKRRRDVDNIKGLLDALTGIVWADDSQIFELTIRRGYNPENPHVDMEVLSA